VSVAIGDERDALVITVEDGGPGFPDGILQPPRAGADRPEHAARLGLRTARAIVAAHRGTLALDNRAGGGARATLRLPTGPDAAAPQTTSGPSTPVV
jgi:signal transduction histidine kinase